MKSKFLIPLFFLLLSACAESGTPERVAERFLSAYLDCRFSDAAKLASPEAVELLHWRASQLTQAEVELMNEQAGARARAERTEEHGEECVVWLSVTDALILDSIGLPAHIGDVRYRVTLKHEKGHNWKVTALIPNP